MNSMKIILVTLLSLFGLQGHAQLSWGNTAADGRDVMPETSFIVEGVKTGWAKFSVAIDRDGNVTSVQLQETNLKSSIDKIQLKKQVYARDPLSQVS